MPSFEQLIANAAPTDDEHSISTLQEAHDHHILTIDAFPFVKSPLTSGHGGVYSPPESSTRARRTKAGKLPIRPSRYSEAVLYKPLPASPSPSEDTNSFAVPDLSAGESSDETSRRSSIDSFSHLLRATDEIENLLTTLKSLTRVKRDEMEDPLECHRLPGMWAFDEYAPISPEQPLSSATKTSMTKRRFSIETYLTASSHALTDSSGQQVCRTDLNDITPTDDLQITDLIAQVYSEMPSEPVSPVFELAAENQASDMPAPSYDSLYSSQSRAELDSSQLRSSAGLTFDCDYNASNELVFPLEIRLPPQRPAPSIPFERQADDLSQSSSGDESASTSRTPSRKSSQSSNEAAAASLCVGKPRSSDFSIPRWPARSEQPTGAASSRAERCSSSATGGKTRFRLPIIAPNNSEGDLRQPNIAQRLPWKGKGRLPLIKTIAWEEIPQEDVGAFCGAFDGLQPLRRPILEGLARNLRVTDEEDTQRTEASVKQSEQRSGECRVAHVKANLMPKTPSLQELALQERIDTMSNKVKNNEGKLTEGLRIMREHFQSESREIARKLKAQQERQAEEARVAAAKIQQEQEEKERQKREERLATQRALIRIECVVCGDDKGVNDYPSKPPTSKCQHKCKICIDCLDSWVSTSLKDNGTDNIKCPECPEKLVYQDVQLAASPVTFAAYDKAATLSALSALPEFNWCLKPGCGYGQLNVANNNYMECVNCGYKQCLKHQTAWHTGDTCAQYEARANSQKAQEEAKTLAMLDSVSKPCPGAGCGLRIQKIDGCDHITCRRCRHEFCWQCLASHKEIKRVGNTAHAKDCKFHSENLDIAWPFNRH